MFGVKDKLQFSKSVVDFTVSWNLLTNLQGYN